MCIIVTTNLSLKMNSNIYICTIKTNNRDFKQNFSSLINDRVQKIGIAETFEYSKGQSVLNTHCTLDSFDTM